MVTTAIGRRGAPTLRASDGVERNQTALCVRTTTGLQGLISRMESEVETKLRKVCKTAKTYEAAAERSMTTMANIYHINRRVLVDRHMSELKFVENAERLAGNLTTLRKQSSRLSQQLDQMRRHVQKQMEDLYRAEVDVDMKLRACHGSCQSVSLFSVDHSSYRTLQSDLDQLDETLNRRGKAATPPKDVPHIKLQPVDVDMAPSPDHPDGPERTVAQSIL